MPYFMSFIPNKKWKCWTVRKRKTRPNAKGRKVFSRCTTKKNAQKQLRLLRALQNNPNFKANGRKPTLRRSARLRKKKMRGTRKNKN